MIKKFTIYGERCSWTNYLENLILKNFNIKLTWDYGWKHFFGFHNLDNSDDVLFICIVRNPFDWLNSLFNNPHHPLRYKNLSEEDKINEFLNKEIYSINDVNYLKKNKKIYSIDDIDEIKSDRNIYTGERYKNIFELRYTKIHFLLEDMPKLVKNTIFIKYEDLINDFENVMIKIKNCGLEVNKDVNFPVNYYKYKKEKRIFKKRENELISKEIILNNKNFNKLIEEKLDY